MKESPPCGSKKFAILRTPAGFTTATMNSNCDPLSLPKESIKTPTESFQKKSPAAKK